MEDDIMKKRAKESICKVVRIVQQNNFIYKGKLTNCDDTNIEVLDFRSNTFHVIKFDWLKHLEVLNE